MLTALAAATVALSPSPASAQAPKPGDVPKAPALSPPTAVWKGPGEDDLDPDPDEDAEDTTAAPRPAPLPPELGGAPPPGAKVDLVESEDRSTVTIEEIVNRVVTTASNREETARGAPAWIITVTADELRARGYRELSDLLDDLPSMDVIRPWGDTYFKSYVRGYRNAIGSPLLLMVDGMVFNHLWLNETTILAAIPLSSVERVEVVYGPASAVYGPNAAMGVINVITRTDASEEGVSSRARFSVHAPQTTLGRFGDSTRAADAHVLLKTESLRVSVAGRFDFGTLEPALGERFEYTRNQYLEDRSLWGDFLDYPNIAGAFRSPSEKQAVDARVIVGKGTELSAQLYRMNNGQGLIYAGDRTHPRIPYVLLEQSLGLQHTQPFSPSLMGVTQLRYRRSNVDGPTAYLDRHDSGPGAISFEYWRSTNASFSASQDFSALVGTGLLLPNDQLQLGFGGRFERRDLEKSYVRSGGENTWDPAEPFVDADGVVRYRFPQPVRPEDNLDNRGVVDTIGAYLLGRYAFLPEHSIDLGLRLDHNALLQETVPTFRGGYVGRVMKPLTVKLLYGQAVQEPTWRDLFGAWDGGGGNPGLRSERSETYEAGAGYELDWLAFTGSAWLVRYRNAIIATTSEGQNLGRRYVGGVDLGATALVPVPGVRQLRVWAYYSPYLYTKQSDPAGGSGLVEIGDLARHKVLGGATLELNRSVGATVRGRFASARQPVASNPLGEVPGYFTLDANLLLRDVGMDGLSLSLRCTNLLDAKYDHPGVVDANSGATPGAFVDGRWAGSGGYYNSRLPQPGRAVAVELQLEL